MASFTDKRINRSLSGETREKREDRRQEPPRGNQSRGPVFRDSADGEIASRRPRSDYSQAQYREGRIREKRFLEQTFLFLSLLARNRDSSKSRLRSNGNRVEERVIFLRVSMIVPILSIPSYLKTKLATIVRRLFIMEQFGIISNS